MFHKIPLVCLLLIAVFIVVNTSPADAADNLKLQSASINDGAVTLIPPFTPDNKVYKAVVDDSVESITLKAAASSGSVLVNNTGTGPSGTKVTLSYGRTLISVVVRDSSDNSTSYQFMVDRTSSRLKSLKFSTGSLTPAFQRDTLGYTLNFAGFTNTIDINAIMEDPYATMKFDDLTVTSGTSFRPVRNMAVGDNIFNLAITSQNGETTTYTLNLRRSSQAVPYSSAQSSSTGNISANSSGTGLVVSETIDISQTSSSLFPKTQLTSPEGRTTLSVVINQEQLTSVLKDEKSNSAIDAVNSSPVDKTDISLTKEAMKLWIDSGKSVVLDSGQVVLSLKAGALVKDAGSTDSTVSVDSVDSADKIEAKLTLTAANNADPVFVSKPAAAAQVVTAFGMTAELGGRSLAVFEQPVKLSVQLDPTRYRDSDLLGLYAYDTARGAWVYVGGSVKPGSVIVAETNRIATFAVMESAPAFRDIAGHWASRAIERMTAMHIASGVTSDLFAPETLVTRAEFASLLTRTLRLPAAPSAAAPFSDIPDNAWYKDELVSAYTSGLVDGLSSAEFGPDKPISREQMAVMLVRAYAYAIGIRAEDMVVGNHTGFADEAAIGGWALRSVWLAESAQLMEGSSDGAFLPQAQTTRAEAVVALSRLLDRIGN